MTNSGDYEKMQRTVFISTTRENIIPMLTKDKHKTSFKDMIFSKLAKNPHSLRATAINWTEKSFHLEFQTRDMAWKSLESLTNVQIPWKGIDGRSEAVILETRCSLIGYKKPPNRGERKNSFVVSESLVNI